MNNWFDRSCTMERFSQSSYPYRRVKAQDYMHLMRLVEKKPAGLPATDEMNRLLEKMVADLEDAVANVYINTIAVGHTPSRMMYPCPECYGSISSIDDIYEAWENNEVLMHYWNVGEYIEEEHYGEDIDSVPDEIREAFEGQARPQFGDGGDGIFICSTCGLIKTPDDLDQYMKSPFSGGRGILISDQVEHIIKYLKNIKAADTFERKFPYFEGIIEWVHGSGDISEWFIEGGSNTISNYRSSRLPSRYEEGQYGNWIHPHRRNKDWNWSEI